MITVWPRRALHVLFNGVKRDDKASVLVDKKSTPNGHSLNIVVLDLGAFLKKDPNFVSERAFGRAGEPESPIAWKPKSLGFLFLFLQASMIGIDMAGLRALSLSASSCSLAQAFGS